MIPSPPVVFTEDAFRRRVSYLRVSLTDHCNLRCRYCMPNGAMQFLPNRELLTLDELKILLRVFRSLGVHKVRLTGGEPLLRPDLEQIFASAVELKIPDVSITTNAVLLASRIKSLKAAGLKRVNISLDTFDREKFYAIAKVDALSSVLQGIDAAIESGLQPLKINMVVMREWNFNEVQNFALFAQRNPVEIRFLELMPTANSFEGKAGVDEKSFVSMQEIRNEVEKVVTLLPEEAALGVARVFPISGGLGKVGFINPVSNHFCGSCNRIRLTSGGGLKTCLHGPESVNLKNALRNGASDDELGAMIRQAIFAKPEEHFIRPDHYVSRWLQMSQVGG